MGIFNKIKNWLGFGDGKSTKKIAYNDDAFAIYNVKGKHRVEAFTGHISFGDMTECDVVNATIDFVIENPGYIDGTVEYHAPWSRLVNQLYWRDGTVKNGKLRCNSFDSGEFNGDTLVIVKNKMNGKFNGKTLNEYVGQ